MKFLEAFYSKVFVNIVANKEGLDVSVEVYAKKVQVSGYEKSFSEIDESMLDFIESYTSESPYYYISVLDSSSTQGAIPTCLKNRLSYYQDVSDCEYKCHDSKWTYYTSKTNLYDMEKKYKRVGIDFIFSPFSVLAHFFKDKLEGQTSLYLLIEDYYISVGVFADMQLLYAEHLNISDYRENEELYIVNDEQDDGLELELDDSIDLEGINAIDDMDSLDSLDDFGDIEDLDSLEDIDEFSDTQDIEEEFNQEQEEELVMNAHSSSSDDYKRFFLIQNSINAFYKDDKYESEFIDNVYVADAVGVSLDMKRYFEEEMFMNVYIRRIVLGDALLELAKEELSV